MQGPYLPPISQVPTVSSEPKPGSSALLGQRGCIQITVLPWAPLPPVGGQDGAVGMNSPSPQQAEDRDTSLSIFFSFFFFSLCSV